MLTSAIGNLAQICMICGDSFGGRMWPLTYCHQQACNTLLRRTHLEVRLPDIRHDPAVVDLLLTLAHAAATSSSMALLPECPITTGPNILQTPNSMSATFTLQTSSDLSASVKRLGASTEAPSHGPVQATAAFSPSQPAS